MTAQPNKLLAERFGFDFIEVPGGHLGFLFAPDTFAQALLEILH